MTNINNNSNSKWECLWCCRYGTTKCCKSSLGLLYERNTNANFLTKSISLNHSSNLHL